MLFRRGKNSRGGECKKWMDTDEGGGEGEGGKTSFRFPFSRSTSIEKETIGAVRGRGMRIVRLLMDALLDFSVGNARGVARLEPLLPPAKPD